MKYLFFKINILLFFSLFKLLSQDTFKVNKIDSGDIQIDGDLSESVWQNAKIIPIEFEIEPANNVPTMKKTLVYILYSGKELFIAYQAFEDPENIRASIRSRDAKGFWTDDVIIAHIDTFRDARSNVCLAGKPVGSQFDVL